VAIVVRADELMRDFPSEGDDVRYWLSDDPVTLARQWFMILLLALRDHATSVHYHPWREDGGLAYVVDGVRYPLDTPPSEESAGAVLAAAWSLFTEPGWLARDRRGTGSGWLARLRRRAGAGAACATFGMDLGFDVFLWDAVVWSSGERSGVELFRVAPGVAPRLPDAVS
jgi:hypothetical protein